MVNPGSRAPVRSLSQLLRPYLPRLSWQACAILDALVLTKGSLGDAETVACQLGFHNRFDLARHLKRQRLPALHELRNWVRVFTWLETWDRCRVPLFSQALRTGHSAAVAYRIVRRLTGLRWNEVRRRGLNWALRRFRRRCGVTGQAAAVAPSTETPRARRAARPLGSRSLSSSYRRVRHGTA